LYFHLVGGTVQDAFLGCFDVAITCWTLTDALALEQEKAFATESAF